MIRAIIDNTIHQVPNSPGETILDSLIKFNVDVPYSCKSGYCSVCKCKLETGNIDVDDDSILTSKEKKSGFIIACQSYPKNDVVINYDYL